MSSIRVLKSIVPPLLWSAGSDFKRRLTRSATRLEYAPQGWSTPLPVSGTQGSWDAFIAQERSACQALIARVRCGEPLLTNDADERTKHITFGYVLALAAREKPTLSVLDYGGNLGDYYWLARALVPGVALDYHCNELPQLAAVGRDINPEVTWHTGDECLEQSHDLVMFVSSLDHLPQWQTVLERAAQATRQYLFLSDVPTVCGDPYVMTVRHAGTMHLQSALNRSEVAGTAERAGLRLLREFEMGAHPAVANAPEQPTCHGWLFQR